MMEQKDRRGGYRLGGGRPKGWTKPDGVRGPRQMRAYPDEWELVKRFAKIIKHGDRAACEAFLDKQEAKIE